MPINLRPLVGRYFFLAGFFAFLDFLAIILLVFSVLTPLRHVSFPAEEPSMAAGAATVNPGLASERS